MELINILNKEEVLSHAMSFNFGGMSRNELGCLYDISDNKNVLELGSMVGMSSYVIASVAKSVSCVDIWSDTQEHLVHDKQQADIYKSLLPQLPNMYDEFIKNCEVFIKNKKIIMYRGNTHDMSSKFNDGEFDLILIDADHSYEGVQKDFELYNHKIHKNGLIVFHDYGDSMWTGIKQFCDMLFLQKKITYIGGIDRIGIFKKYE